MSIYSNAVKRPITTIMIFTALLIMGLYSMSKLPINFYPEMEMPMMMVATTYPGASASDIETNITKRVEDVLNAVENINEVTSMSKDNMSIVTLEFEWETDLAAAANDIRDQLEFIRDNLPEDASSPTVYKFSTSMMPVIFYAITAEESYEGLEKIIDEKVINILNRIDGIGSVGLSGIPGREVFVDIDPRKLDAYNLSIEAIGGIISAENMNMPSGNVKMGDYDYQLRVEGEFSESNQLKEIVIGNYQGQLVYLKDVATVTDTISDLTVDERVNGQKAMQMFVQKQSGGNTVAVAQAVAAEIEKIKKTLPPDVKIEVLFDTSEHIVNSISNLSTTLMWALLFVILVVLFFLGRWRATFIVAITIPISLIVAFIYLYISGNSINIISLSSLSIAIGMVVDDAIVVLENITKHIERGSRPRSAAIYATNEVWLAVIVTTLVIVAVFMPLTMVGGMTGVLFKQLGWVVTVTTVASTVIAITLTPMLSSLLLKKVDVKDNGKVSFNKVIMNSLDKMDNKYESIIRWTLNHKLLVVISAITIFLASMALSGQVGSDFMPQVDESQVRAEIELQTGMRVEESMKIARQIEEIAQERYSEIDVIHTSSGSADEGFAALFSNSGSNTVTVLMKLKPISERERSCWDIGDDLRSQLDLIPEVINYSVSYTGGMGAGDNSVNIDIYGYDFDKTNDVAAQMAEKFRKVPGAKDINITRKPEKPELQVILDREKLALYGLNTASVSMAVRNRIDGLTASLYREDGDEYEIVVRYAEEFRSSITDIENITVMSPQGTPIRLSEIGEVKEFWSPPNIDRKRRERLVTVKATPHEVNLADFVENLEAEIKDVEMPSGTTYEITGAYEDMKESFADLALLMLIVVLLVYIVMASQFESFKMPFIIMLSIPFAFSGVIIALYITGMTMSVIAVLGAVLLVGIVVKNGIVMVDYINLMRDRGIELYEAIAQAGKSRLRPVLMTALTTMLGMLPMAMSNGDGAEVWSPMGVAVIGGLFFSTLITLVLIPVIYAVFTNKGARKKNNQKQFTFLDSIEE